MKPVQLRQRDKEHPPFKRIGGRLHRRQIIRRRPGNRDEYRYVPVTD